MKRASRLLAVLAMALGWSACGCSRDEPCRPLIRHYLQSPQKLHTIHRVVFIQLDGGHRHPYMAGVMTEALFAAIQKQGVFRLDVLGEDQPQCQDLPLRCREGFTPDQLHAIRQALRCDAILLGEVTQFLPHPRMQLGLSLRLIDLKNGQLVWGVENIWDSTDRRLDERIEDYFEDRLRDGYDPAEERLVHTSPRTFGAFVACEVAATLVPRAPPPAPPLSDQRKTSLPAGRT